jgi:hypothetical protein
MNRPPLEMNLIVSAPPRPPSPARGVQMPRQAKRPTAFQYERSQTNPDDLLRHCLVLTAAVTVLIYSFLPPSSAITLGVCTTVVASLLIAALFNGRSAARLIELCGNIISRARTRARVKRSASQPWAEKPAARVLRWVANSLPPDTREAYVEEQCANLAMAESPRERLTYLADLLVKFPKTIWTYYSERRRARAR